jgi:hypothetical protein
MLAAAWVTRDPSDALMPSFALRIAIAVCVLCPGCGLIAGMYRSRYRRGSLDEVVGVCVAALATRAALTITTKFLIRGERAPPATVSRYYMTADKAVQLALGRGDRGTSAVPLTDPTHSGGSAGPRNGAGG